MDDPEYGSAISRRDFFTACSLLAVGLAACTTLTDHTRTASTFIIDPPPEKYMPVLRDLIRIILPLDRREFPLDLEQVETRLLRLFPLEHERRFMGLQRTLVFFNQLDLVAVPAVAKVLIEEERKAADAPARISRADLERLICERIAREATVFSNFADSLEPKVRYFTALPPERKREYFDLWADSELLIKREFAGGLRYLVMATAYSDERVWPALGYDGPLVERERGRG